VKITIDIPDIDKRNLSDARWALEMLATTQGGELCLTKESITKWKNIITQIEEKINGS